MPNIRKESADWTVEFILASFEPWALSPDYQLAGKDTPQSESHSQIAGKWEKSDNTEQGNNDDVQLHELMENIKRYIRSIDISNL